MTLDPQAYEPRPLACACCANTAGPWIVEYGWELLCVACSAWVAETVLYVRAVMLRRRLGFDGPPPWRARWAPCVPGEKVPWG